jgi:hypothetical protein
LKDIWGDPVRNFLTNYRTYFVVLLVAALILFAHVWGLIPAQINVCKTFEETGHQNCSLHPLLPGIVAWVNANEGFVLSIATIAIGAFTYKLWDSTHKLWSVTRDGLKLAGDEFNATHRPRLRVRNIRIETVRRGHPIAVRFTVANIGETQASIILSDISLVVTLPNGETVTYQHAIPIPDVRAGESLLIQREIGPPWAGEWKLTQAMNGRISIFGIIKYRGKLHPLETAFERVYDHKTRRFWPLKFPDPDHEHED